MSLNEVKQAEQEAMERLMDEELYAINLDNEIDRRFPHVSYEGGVEEHEDRMDYVSPCMKSVRLA